MQAAPGNWKRQGNGSSLGPRSPVRLCWASSYTARKLILFFKASGPQHFWHREPVSRKTAFPHMGVEVVQVVM